MWVAPSCRLGSVKEAVVAETWTFIHLCWRYIQCHLLPQTPAAMLSPSWWTGPSNSEPTYSSLSCTWLVPGHLNETNNYGVMFSHILSMCRDSMPAPYFLSCLLPKPFPGHSNLRVYSCWAETPLFVCEDSRPGGGRRRPRWFEQVGRRVAHITAVFPDVK